MSNTKHTRWMIGAAMAIALVANSLLMGMASAQTASGPQIASSGGTTFAAGTPLTIQGTSYQADEPVSFWINVPAGMTISSTALGQTDTNVQGNAIPIDAIANTDDTGAFIFTVDTSGLPDGSYSLVAHGLNSHIDQVLSFTISSAAPASAPAPTAANTSALNSGAEFTVKGTGFQNSEPIGFWINVPAAVTISAASLGQTDTAMAGNAVGLDKAAYADSSGTFIYTVDTSGLPDGSYSLVAYGQFGHVTQVFPFSISGFSTTLAPTPASGTPLTAGAVLTVKGTGFQNSEPVSFWINVPAGMTVASTALGQTDTVVDGTAIPLDKIAYGDSFGTFSYDIDTSGLPSGSYSVVAHGLHSGVNQVFTFTIQ